MAVGNSSMLQDLCLSLMGFSLEGAAGGFEGHIVGLRVLFRVLWITTDTLLSAPVDSALFSPFPAERPTDPLLLLRILSPSLHKLTLAAEKGSQRLKWALSFEEAYCSGGSPVSSHLQCPPSSTCNGGGCALFAAEPEGCMKGLVKAGGCGPSPSPLSESLLRGLRGMDLKGQLVVRGSVRMHACRNSVNVWREQSSPVFLAAVSETVLHSCKPTWTLSLRWKVLS